MLNLTKTTDDVKVLGVDISPSLDRIETSRHNFLTLYCLSCGYSYSAWLRCGDRTCPECRKRDYFRLFNSYLPFIQTKKNLRLITLTLRGRPSCLTRDRLVRLHHCFTKLTHLRAYRYALVGGLYAIEAINKGNGWNVHIHILAEGLFIGQKKLSRDWHRLTGDSFIVDIRKFRSPKRGLEYLLKYMLKPPVVAGLNGMYNSAFKGSRLVSAFGIWYGVVISARFPLECPKCGGVAWISEHQLLRGMWFGSLSPPRKAKKKILI